MVRIMRQTVGVFLILTFMALAAAPTIAAGESGPEKIDINAAAIEELTELPGIGRAYAQRIVDYRKKNGPFRKIEDLLNVRGIGDATLEKIRDRVMVKKR